MRTRAEFDETGPERSARFRLRGARARAALEKLKDLETIKSDKEYRRQAQTIVDEGLDDGSLDTSPQRHPKSYRFIAFLKEREACAGHGKNQQDALSDAEARVPGCGDLVHCDVLEFTNTKGREIWENKILLPYAKKIADGSLPSRMSASGIKMLIDGTKKAGVIQTRGGPGRTFRWLYEGGFLANLGGKASFTTDIGREVLRMYGIKV